MDILWIFIASLTGFGIAALFSGILKLERNIYLLLYIPLVITLFALFINSNNVSIRDLISNNWYWGLAGAVIAGAFVIKNVYSQPSSPRSKGPALLTDILWSGVAYGMADALLLSVLPVMTVRLSFANSIMVQSWYGIIGLGFIALISSFIVTTAYHLGYTEFRGKQVLWPNVGNGVLSLAYILTMNPLAAILPHIAMHIAAMIHGRETTGQVPPHYKNNV